MAFLFVLMGGYLRLYGAKKIFGVHTHTHGVAEKYNQAIVNIASSPLKLVSLYAACSLFAFILHTIGYQIMIKILGSDPLFRNIINYLNPLIFLMGVSLLLLFANINLVRFSKWLRISSPLSFSVYLIHFHRKVVEVFGGIFAPVADYPLWAFIPACIFIPGGIYIICSLIDFVRLKMFKLANII